MALVETSEVDHLMHAAGPAHDGICKDGVDLICKEMMHRTDDLLQDKVNQLLSSAAGQLQSSFDRQQAQVHSTLEAELHSCRDKVKSLEAEKEQMQKTVFSLQGQLAALSAQIYGQKCGWPAGMVGPFATFPVDSVKVATSPSQPSTTAPTSPFATMSAPPTPGGCAPPPGLELQQLDTMALPPLPPLPSACIAPPPGLTDLPADNWPLNKGPSATISLDAAINPPVLEEKARQTPEELHMQALHFMQSQTQKDCADFALRDPACGNRFSSPPRASPVPRVGYSVPGLNTTPKRTPRQSHGKITPGMKTPTIAASPFVICESGGTVFGFTIRKADGCSLGLDINHTDMGNWLHVTGIKPGGAIHAWNKQCMGGPAGGKAVMPGDRIVKVNNATTPTEMLQECREQKLLKFMVQRGECDDDLDVLSLYPDNRARGMTY